ncbi:MAG TPA: type VI secretion protein IcmF/TssM N-terminal domain-containing protein [Bryobacteraceae bacterium]
MTIRRLIFVLFLYILLIWIIALRRATDTTQFGLLWTAIGVAVLLAIVLLERVISWWWARRAPNAAPPAAAAQGAPAKVLHEDDVELLRLVREADQRLSGAPGRADAKPSRALDLPVYLVLGPERAGKTAILHHSGIEPALLAGQVTGGDGSVTPTRVANLWLASDSLFLEVSGRVFNAEPGRLAEFLTVVQPWGGTRGWRRWLRMFQPPVSLRGTLLVVDSRAFKETPEPSLLDRSAQQIRERLAVVSSTLGREFPVYVVFTNADALPYFEEFFSGVGETEAGQVMGVLTAEKPEERTQERVWAEGETKRLNRSFMSLFLRLSDRRLLTLSQETDPRRKGAIYEFPREFKRIRTPLVQFLVDVFKPDPLRAGPHLRGFFFTGTRKVERMPAASPDAGQTPTTFWAGGAAPDATQIFSPHGGMTTIFRSRPKAAGSGPLVDRWMFLTELFHTVLGSDRPSVRRAPATFERYRKTAVAAAIGLALFLGLIWTISWAGNWNLITNVRERVREAQRGSDVLNLANLLALDGLRKQLLELDENPWHLHWGLYQGERLREEARRAYFQRLKQLSLNHLNQTLAQDLRQAVVGQNTNDEAIYEELKTHRTITTLGCPADPSLFSKLQRAAANAHPNLSERERVLLTSQLQFYANDIAETGKLPILLAENPDAVRNAQTYLHQTRGPDQQLRRVLEQIDQQLPRLIAAKSVPDLERVLKGQEEVRGAFTSQGRQNFEELLAQNKVPPEEACVMGTTTLQQAAQIMDPGMKEQLQSLYYSQYISTWHDFLASYHVLGYPNGYTDVNDAVSKLDILAAPKSPLLGLVKLVAANTNFQAKGVEDPGVFGKAEDALKGAIKAKVPKGGDKLLENKPASTTAADVTKAFQPASYTTPAESDSLVSEHNQPYIGGLGMLQEKMDALAQASTAAEKLTATGEARMAQAQARNVLKQLTYNFRDFRNNGMDTELSSLLEEPIRLVDPWVKRVDPISQRNGDLQQLVCVPMKPVFSRYPFNSAAPTNSEVSLEDLQNWFAPNSGRVWKYAREKAADLVVPHEGKWEPNLSAQGIKATQELLAFLNGAQKLANAFFAKDPAKPRLTYSLRRTPEQAIAIRLTLDGTKLDSAETSLEKQFTWPAQSVQERGAEAIRILGPGATDGFGSYGALWGTFRLFRLADDRSLGEKKVRWSHHQGDAKARSQEFSPPATVEFVEFPAGQDVFNPAFFDGLQRCPTKAAEELKQ